VKEFRYLAGLRHRFEGIFVPAVLVAFVLIGVLAAVDVLADLAEGTTTLHVVTEVAVIVVALGGVMAIGWGLVSETRTARSKALDLSGRLAGSRREALEWRQKAQSLLLGLGKEIDRQFTTWSLSDAEKEVALLLLKGYSHKEVARLRTVSEATVRQQARAVYHKAGVAGRNELAAFFLEDLALPPA